MAGLIPLYYELLNQQLILGLQNPSPYKLFPIRQEDTPTFDVTVCRRLASKPLGNQAAAAGVSMTGYGCQLSLATSPNGTPLVSASGTTLSNDTFTFTDIALPTGTLLDAVSDGGRLYFEVRLTHIATGYYMGARFETSFIKAVALSGTLATPFADRAVSLSELEMRLKALRVKQIEIESQDGTKSGVLFMDNNGVVQLPGPPQ